MGAPGAGKGTNTPFIHKIRGLTTPPIVMSDLLTSPEVFFSFFFNIYLFIIIIIIINIISYLLFILF